MHLIWVRLVSSSTPHRWPAHPANEPEPSKHPDPSKPKPDGTGTPAFWYPAPPPPRVQMTVVLNSGSGIGWSFHRYDLVQDSRHLSGSHLPPVPLNRGHGRRRWGASLDRLSPPRRAPRSPQWRNQRIQNASSPRPSIDSSSGTPIPFALDYDAVVTEGSSLLFSCLLFLPT